MRIQGCGFKGSLLALRNFKKKKKKHQPPSGFSYGTHGLTPKGGSGHGSVLSGCKSLAQRLFSEIGSCPKKHVPRAYMSCSFVFRKVTFGMSCPFRHRFKKITLTVCFLVALKERQTPQSLHPSLLFQRIQTCSFSYRLQEVGQ